MSDQLEIPDYLKGYQDKPTGREAAEGFDAGPKIPFLQITQKMSDATEDYQLGAVVTAPEKEGDKARLLFPPGQEFTVTPITCFPKFVLARKKIERGKNPRISSSYWPGSQNAMRCMPRRKADRTIEDPNNPGSQLEYRVEFQYLVYIWELDEYYQFSLFSGEEETHELWTSLITARGKLPLYTGRYTCKVGKHPRTFKSEFSWYGFDFKNATQSFTPAEKLGDFEAMMKKMTDFIERVIAAERTKDEETKAASAAPRLEGPGSSKQYDDLPF